MDSLIAVYDACVLYPDFLRNLLVRLAIHGRRQGLFRAKWTGRIHREWIHAVLRQRPDLDRANLLRTRRLMDRHVLGCRVRGYERWERRLMLPDTHDRHVLAAALVCAADFIVTFNTRHFPQNILDPFHITPVTPDQLLQSLTDSGIVVSAAAEHRASLTRPRLPTTEYLDALRRNGLPLTAAALPASQI